MACIANLELTCDLGKQAECAEIRTFLQTTTASKEETIFTLRFELAEKSGILENLQVGNDFNLRQRLDVLHAYCISDGCGA